MTYGMNADARKTIDTSEGHLSAKQIRSLSYILNYRPFVMDFEDAPKQTFGLANCTRESNHLLVADDKRQGVNTP
jgi:hypothetical protein